MFNPKEKFEKMAVKALHELSRLENRRRPVKQQALLLEQRSVEEMNQYFASQAFKARERLGKKPAIAQEELYVSLKNGRNNRFDCAYFLGEMYYFPPIQLPGLQELREWWSYMLTLPFNPCWGPFDSFLHTKIIDMLTALRRYEEILEGDILPLQYVLLSDDGVTVHNTLYTQAQETLVRLREQQGMLELTKAPTFLVSDVAHQMKTAQDALEILGAAKPRRAG